MVDTIHGLIALIVVAAVVVAIGWSAVLALQGGPGGAAYVSLQAAVVAVIIVAAVTGLLLLAVGRSPAEGLHFLYAAMAIAIIPLARSFLGHAETRRQILLLLLAFLILGALVFRLFTSG